MEDNNNNEFNSIRDAFTKFAAKLNDAHIVERVVRTVATGGKAAVDQGLQEFPPAFVSQVAQDVYGLITSQEIANGISSTVRSLDEEKVKDALDALVNRIKDPEVALDIAEKVKMLLDKSSSIDIQGQMDGLLDMVNVPQNARFIVSIFLSQAGPVLDSMRNDSVEEIAAKITGFADLIPSDVIAEQVAGFTRQVTPEKISKETNALVGKLPSPKAVADIAHGIGHSVSEHLDSVAKISDVSEVRGILADLAQDVQKVVGDTISNDNVAKKNLPKTGGKFDL